MLKKILHPDAVDSLIHGSTAHSLALIRTLSKICTSPVLLRKKGVEENKGSGDDYATRQGIGAALDILPANAQPDDFSLSGTNLFHLTVVHVFSSTLRQGNSTCFLTFSGSSSG